MLPEGIETGRLLGPDHECFLRYLKRLKECFGLGSECFHSCFSASPINFDNKAGSNNYCHYPNDGDDVPSHSTLNKSLTSAAGDLFYVLWLWRSPSEIVTISGSVGAGCQQPGYVCRSCCYQSVDQRGACPSVPARDRPPTAMRHLPSRNVPSTYA